MWWNVSICLMGDWRWRSVEGLDRCHSFNVLQWSMQLSTNPSTLSLSIRTDLSWSYNYCFVKPNTFPSEPPSSKERCFAISFFSDIRELFNHTHDHNRSARARRDHGRFCVDWNISVSRQSQKNGCSRNKPQIPERDPRTDPRYWSYLFWTADWQATGTKLPKLEWAQSSIHRAHTYDFCHAGRSLLVIGRSISIISFISADD